MSSRHQIPRHPQQPVQPYSPSLAQFCQFIDLYTRQTEKPESIAAVCEAQAEAVRITRQDVSVETIDLLLDTLLNVLTTLEHKQQQGWRQRVKSRFLPRLRRRRQHFIPSLGASS